MHAHCICLLFRINYGLQHFPWKHWRWKAKWEVIPVQCWVCCDGQRRLERWFTLASFDFWIWSCLILQDMQLITESWKGLAWKGPSDHAGSPLPWCEEPIWFGFVSAMAVRGTLGRVCTWPAAGDNSKQPHLWEDFTWWQLPWHRGHGAVPRDCSHRMANAEPADGPCKQGRLREEPGQTKELRHRPGSHFDITLFALGELLAWAFLVLCFCFPSLVIPGIFQARFSKLAFESGIFEAYAFVAYLPALLPALAHPRLCPASLCPWPAPCRLHLCLGHLRPALPMAVTLCGLLALLPDAPWPRVPCQGLSPGQQRRPEAEAHCPGPSSAGSALSVSALSPSRPHK